MTTTSQANAQLGNVVSRHAFTTRQPRARPLRSVIRAVKQDEREQSAPSEMALRAVGALAAAQLAFFPAGAALADQPIKAAVRAGEAAQGNIPEGAANPNTREERNTNRDFGIRKGLNVIKERVSADNIVNAASGIEAGGRQNIFEPLLPNNPSQNPSRTAGANVQQGVSYSFDTGLAAPSLQMNVGNPAAQAKDAVKDAVNNGPLDKLKGAIDSAAVTGNSPQRQLDQAGDKAKQTVEKVKQSNAAFNPQAGLQHSVSFGGPPQAVTDKSDDLDNASFQGPEANEGGVTQPTTRPDIVGGSGVNPKRGGDLKDSGTEFAAQNKGERDEGTPGLTGATPRAGANTPKGTNELRNPQTPVLPNFLGGKNFLRDDSETPEQAASGNIAKAQQSSGNAIDSVKKGLGL